LGVSVEVFLQMEYKKAVFEDLSHHLIGLHKE
jgi:hypothetical protein